MSSIYVYHVTRQGQPRLVTQSFPETLYVSEGLLRQVRECKHEFLHMTRREHVMACLDNGEAVYVPDGTRRVGTYHRIYQRIDWLVDDKLPPPATDDGIDPDWNC